MAAVIKAGNQTEVIANGLPEQRLFTAGEYQRLADTGVLNEYERIELPPLKAAGKRRKN